MAKIEDIEKFNYKTIPIPNNATNGDVIKAIFPNISIEEDNLTGYVVVFGLDEKRKVFLMDWWNATYKKEQGDKE